MAEVAGEAAEVVVEGEADRSRLTQHPEAAAEVEMKPTKPGPGLGAGTGRWRGQEGGEEGEPGVWRVLEVEEGGGGPGPGQQ